MTEEESKRIVSLSYTFMLIIAAIVLLATFFMSCKTTSKNNICSIELKEGYTSSNDYYETTWSFLTNNNIGNMKNNHVVIKSNRLGDRYFNVVYTFKKIDKKIIQYNVCKLIKDNNVII